MASENQFRKKTELCLPWKIYCCVWRAGLHDWLFKDKTIHASRKLLKKRILHEEVIRGTLSSLVEKTTSIKGEIVIVVEGNNSIEESNDNYEELINNLIKKGYTKRDAIREISDNYGINKNKLYNLVKEK